jgi:hypothetical protein
MMLALYRKIKMTIDINKKLSQAERTAIHKIVDTDARGTCLLAEEVWLAARDYGREHEQALEAALDFLTDTERLDISQATVTKFARAALASPGEPEGQQPSKRITKPDEFPRFLECPGCGMKRLFSPYEGRCDECRSLQPDHGPGEPVSIVLTEDELAEIRRGGCVIRDGISICYD